MVRISRPDGQDEGWVRTDRIFRVGLNSMQRFVYWIDELGEERCSVVDRAQDAVIMELVGEVEHVRA